MPVLELLRPHHATRLLAFERENRDYFALSISDRGDEYFDEFDERLAALLAEQGETGASYVAVTEDGSVVGRFNLYFVEDGVANLGYRVARRAAGRGVATECVRELCGLAASQYAMTTIKAATAQANVASQRVLEKAGFLLEGPADPSEIGGKQGSWYRRDLGDPDT
jgi:ribosomal-protein-alanine N-acetyltransferase